MTRMKATRWLAVAGLIGQVLLGACRSRESPTDQGVRTVRSWAATVRSTSDALRSGAVPRVYARQVLTAARETQSRLSQQPEWQSLPGTVREELGAAILELALSVGQRTASFPRS